jgi:diguanylate cyclase (GGDEF)-like protein/PAS domain S-box-containing protein
MLGRGRDELLGRRDQEFTHPDDRQADVDAAWRILRGELDTWQVEKRFVRADGAIVWAIANMSFLRDGGGGPLCWVGHFQDITERKRVEVALEREHRDLQAAQAVARVGSWDHDLLTNRPGTWSDEMWRIAGRAPAPQAPTPEEFVAMIHPGDRDRVRAAITSQTCDHTLEEEFRMLTGDGRELVVAFRRQMTRDEHGRPLSAFGTIQDITDRAQHDAEQAALRRIAELVAARPGPAAVFDAVAREVCELFGAHRGTVTRFDAECDSGTVVSDYLSTPEPLVGPTSRTVAAAISVAGRPWGRVDVVFTGRRSPADAETRLGRFADLVAMAIANADAWNALARQASCDALTGLANHRTFHERLRAEVARARRYGRALTLALFDLDHFKQVNDTHGHQVGDQVLIDIAGRLHRHAREGELVARLGGEEFAWLMPETDQHGAFQAVERFRSLVEAAAVEVAGRITVSAGLCALEPGLDGDDLVRFADRALYWAKDSGRNCAFVFTPEAHALLSANGQRLERAHAMSSVRALARAIDSKDPSTRRHSERVADMAQRLAIELGWSPSRAAQLHTCGLLHDVGKIGIPDEILLRPGPLSDEEYRLVKRHPVTSAQIAAEVLDHEQVAWIRGHHERWDGRGYPDGLAGAAIPDGAAVLALADAWDAMTQTRTYKPPLATAEALEELAAESGRQFAPAVVQAMLALHARR